MATARTTITAATPTTGTATIIARTGAIITITIIISPIIVATFADPLVTGGSATSAGEGRRLSEPGGITADQAAAAVRGPRVGLAAA